MSKGDTEYFRDKNQYELNTRTRSLVLALRCPSYELSFVRSDVEFTNLENHEIPRQEETNSAQYTIGVVRRGLSDAIGSNGTKRDSPVGQFGENLGDGKYLRAVHLG